MTSSSKITVEVDLDAEILARAKHHRIDISRVVDEALDKAVRAALQAPEAAVTPAEPDQQE